MREVHMTVGAPGSGKSTWAKEMIFSHGYIRLSLDNIRTSLWGSKREFWKQVESGSYLTNTILNQTYNKMLLHLLQTVRPLKLVLDNTHIRYGKEDDQVQTSINILDSCGYEPFLDVFMVPFNELLLRNEERTEDDQVPPDYLKQAFDAHHHSNAWWRGFTDRVGFHYTGHR